MMGIWGGVQVEGLVGIDAKTVISGGGAVNEFCRFCILFVPVRALPSFHNGGASWSHVQVATNAGNLGNDTGSFDVVPHGSAGSHILYKADGGSFGRIYRSNDDGDSWALVKSFPSGKDYQAASCLHCPYHENSDGLVLYIGFDNGSHKSTDGGVTSSPINGDAATSVKRTGIETYTVDADIVVHWKNDDTMWVSTDGAATFTQRPASGLSGTLQGTGVFRLRAAGTTR